MRRILFISSLLCVLTACDDYLDRQPESSVTPEVYMNDAEHLDSYVLKTYSALIKGHHGRGFATLLTSDFKTDDKAKDEDMPLFQPGELRVDESGGEWSFDNIRNCNYFFAEVLPKYKAGAISGDENLIKHYIGEMCFFRAYEYFNKVKKLGDFPIITEVQGMDCEALVTSSKREPRTKVIRFILQDLEDAITMMQDKSPDNGKRNRLSKDVARLFKSRVALFEASWLRNFAGTAFVPNGIGWPGEEVHPDFQFEKGSIEAEVDDLLDIAMEYAKQVAEAHPELTTNNGILKQEESDVNNPYFFMFGDCDLSGYDEVLLWRDYDQSLGIIHGTTVGVTTGNYFVGVTKGLVDSYLMRDGRPYYVASQEQPYVGDDYIADVVKNRDNRLQLFLKVPGQKNKVTNIDFEISPAVETYPMLFHPSWGYTTGYALRKYGNFDGKQTNQQFGSDTGCPIFRTVEAYLNYIEASYMKNGVIDDFAAKYWEKIRTRALVDDNYQNTINLTDMNKEAEGDWAAYTAGELVDATMYNIRRERRNEFISEGMRKDDLLRWRSMDQMIVTPYIVKGFKLWGPMEEWYKKEDGTSELIDFGNNPNVSPRSESDYLLPYQINPKQMNYGGLRWTMAHYLTPIAAKHFILTGGENSVIYQNPGWKTTAGSSAVE